jgi:hypothetical protein
VRSVGYDFRNAPIALSHDIFSFHRQCIALGAFYLDFSDIL